MPDIGPITAARAAIVPTFSKQFILRFAISLLLTSARDCDCARVGPNRDAAHRPHL